LYLRKSAAFLVGGTLLAATWLGGPYAMAAGKTWTISPGGDYTTSAVTASLTDTATGTKLTCAFTQIKSASFRSGSGLSGNLLGHVDAFGSPICYLPNGLGFSFGSRTMVTHGISYNASDGVTTGKFVSEAAYLGVGGYGCSGDIAGPGGALPELRYTYTNSDATLKIPPVAGELEFFNVQACQGLLDINSGDPVTFSFTAAVSPAQTITSP
jgi:hypothetical protein